MISYITSVATIGAITAILCLGVNVSWGWVGQLDLAYYAYVAVGAYFAAVLELPRNVPQPGLNYSYILGLHLPFLLGVLGAAVVGALVSAIVGTIALRRVRSDYIAIITAVTALMAAAFLGQSPYLFGGQIGTYGIPLPFQSALNLSPQNYNFFFLGLMLVFLVITYVVLQALYKSPFGRSLRAIREGDVAASAFGRNLFSMRLRAYIIGGTVGAFGGSLFVNYISAWNPSSWNIFEVVLILSGVVVGGRANSIGVIVGSVLVLSIIPEITRLISVFGGSAADGPAVAALLAALLIIMILRFRPAGLIPERKLTSAGPSAHNAVGSNVSQPTRVGA